MKLQPPDGSEMVVSPMCRLDVGFFGGIGSYKAQATTEYGKCTSGKTAIPG